MATLEFFRPAQLWRPPVCLSGRKQLLDIGPNPAVGTVTRSPGRGPAVWVLVWFKPQVRSRRGRLAVGGTQPPNTASSSSAIAMLRWSAPCRAATWTPTGSPCRLSPSGTSVTGTPARLKIELDVISHGRP